MADVAVAALKTYLGDEGWQALVAEERTSPGSIDAARYDMQRALDVANRVAAQNAGEDEHCGKRAVLCKKNTDRNSTRPTKDTGRHAEHCEC